MAIKFLNTATAATQTVGDNSTKIATTAYADAAASAIPIGNYLPLAGGTMANTNLVTNMNADLLDGKDHTAFGATLATYGTTAGSSGRIRITAPFNTNSGHMFQITVSIYSSYTIHTYVVGGYMYSTTNNWYASQAVYSGTGSPDIVVGRDGNGKAYISIANGNYAGVRVHNMTRGYQTSVADTYDPWTISITGGTENSITPSIYKTWNSGNDGSGSGLDADLLDGQQGSYYASAASLGNYLTIADPTFTGTLTGPAATITTVTGDLVGNATTATSATSATTATTATTSNLIKVNDYSGATNMRILGSHQTGGSDNVYSASTMYLNCDTGIINATGFAGALTGNVTGNLTGNVTGNASGVSETGYGSDNFTFYQTSSAFAGYTGWANYYIGNHGNGSNYYNTVHIMPFWGAPKYSRLEGNVQTAVYDYWTSENHTPSNYLPLAGGIMNTNAAITMSGSLTTSANVYAQRFYDQGNNAYYGDFAGTSQFNHVKVNSVLGTRNFVSGSYGWQLEQSTTTANPVTFRFDNQKYRIYAGGGAGEIMTFLEGGNVGIRNTNPDEKLEVSGSSASDYPHIKISNPGETGRYMKIGMIDSINHCIEANGGSTYLTFKTNATERMRIASNGAIKFNEYTSTSYKSGVTPINPIQSFYPSNGVGSDNTTDLAVDQQGNVVRTTQEATWKLTRTQVDALTTSTAGTTLLSAPGSSNLFIIIEKVTFLIEFVYNNNQMSTSQQYQIIQDGNIADEIALINGTRINNIAYGGGSTNTSGIYEHDTGYSTLNRTYKPNTATTIRRVNTGALNTAVSTMSIKIRYRVYDKTTF